MKALDSANLAQPAPFRAMPIDSTRESNLDSTLDSADSIQESAQSAVSADILRFSHNDKKYVILPENEYNQMLENLRRMDEMIIQNLIEKEIAREMPKDLEDVCVVAKSMLKNRPNIAEIRRTVREIKARYPNLFIDVNEYFKSAMEFDD